MNAARPLLVIVTGPPASGKTTIAAELARLLDLPAFHKDAIKERLADDIPGASLEWSRQLGAASYGQLYLAASVLLRSGRSCLLEANFHPDWSLPELRLLADGCDVAQIVCSGEPDRLMERYLRRFGGGTRHAVHLDDHPDRLTKLADDFQRDHQLALDGLKMLCDTTAGPPVEPRELADQVRAWRDAAG